jgi:hypothetical protein
MTMVPKCLCDALGQRLGVEPRKHLNAVPKVLRDRRAIL